MVKTDELKQRFIDFFDCDYEFIEEGVDYDVVMDKFNAACKEGQTLGYTPIIVTLDETLLETFELNTTDDDNNYSLDLVRQYRNELLNSDLEDGKEILDSNLELIQKDMQDEGFTEDELVGEYEEGDALNNPISFLDYQTDTTSALFIVKVPVKEPWKIFAYLPMGNWNECPDSLDFMAISKYYYDKYKAYPIAMTHDVVEFKVEHPIENEHEAMDEVLYHYAFCQDILQNFDTLGSYAGTLVDSKVWFFWWD